MKRVLILVEGQTEETFVRDVLAPHFITRNVALTPKILVTRRVKSGGHFKGGVVNYAQVKRELHLLLADTGAERITTMLDYYGLPEDFPGLAGRPSGTCYQRVEHVERAFQADIAHPRFLPYLALHEFEALLFTEPARCDWSSRMPLEPSRACRPSVMAWPPPRKSTRGRRRLPPNAS